jgi:hypothetical protein
MSADFRMIFAFVAIGVVFSYFITISSFLIRLDLYHHELWTGFGSPRVVPNSLSNQFRLNKFVVLGRYRALGDDVLNRRGTLVRLALAAFFLLVVSAPFIAPPH